MANAAFSVGEAVGNGWTLFKERALFWVGVAAILYGSQIVLNIVGGAFGEGVLGLIWSLITWGVVTWLSLGFVSMVLATVDGGTPPLESLWATRPIYWHYLLASLLYAVAIGIGFFLLVIPGIYLIVRFGFWPFVMIERQTPITDTFKIASNLTEGRRLDILLFGLTALLILAAGALALLVGLLVALPVAALASATVYRRLTTAAPADSMIIQPAGGTGA